MKGLIWYNTGELDRASAPATWDELKTAAAAAATGDEKTWCIGVESGGDSGWPGTDWIEDIVLRQAGTDVYDGWVAGTTPWTDPAIKAAFEEFGTAVDERLRRLRLRQRHRTSARRRTRCSPTRPAACSTTRPASSPTSSSTEAGATPDQFDFFPFPDIDPANSGA